MKYSTGPRPPSKFFTSITRINKARVQQGLLFFRTSPASRNSRRFLNETRFIPPLIFSACIRTLSDFRYSKEDSDELPLQIYFADEEGDPYTVELAGRLEGYVTGQDSDFAVLNSEGYKGYFPLDEMVWLGTTEDEPEHVMDDGFTQVKNKRKKATTEGVIGQGIIPPNSQNFSLSTSLYTPSTLAQMMNLPVSLLPLLGALVGNDYTAQSSFGTSSSLANTPLATPSSSPPPPNTKSFHNLLFEKRLTPSQRISHTGATLASLLRPQPGTKKKHRAPKSVMDLIQTTVASLVGTSNAPPLLTGSAEQAAIVDRVVEGTLPYAIPVRPQEGEDVNGLGCVLHTALTCPLAIALDRFDDEDSPHHHIIASRYLGAYRAGYFSPLLMDVLTTGTFWPVLFLENPDVECVARSIARSTRTFLYSILDNGIGLPEPDDDDEVSEEEAEEDPNGVEGENVAEEDDDELIDVVEEYSDDEDDVDRLRGALLDLSRDEDEDMDTVVSNSLDLDVSDDMVSTVRSSSVRSPIALEQPIRRKRRVSKRPKVIIEYLRRGSRIVGEEVQVPELSEYASILPQDTGDTPLQLLPEERRFEVLLQFLGADLDGIRALDKGFLLPVLALRLVVRCMHERSMEVESKERLQERWTRKEARAFLATAQGAIVTIPAPPEEVSERAIQLTAQLSTAIEALELSAQVLFLTDLVPGWAHHFSGKLFHSLLHHGCQLDDKLWRVASEGLDVCFAEERKSKKTKKGKKHSPLTPVAPSGKGNGNGMFSLLSTLNM